MRTYKFAVGDKVKCICRYEFQDMVGVVKGINGNSGAFWPYYVSFEGIPDLQFNSINALCGELVGHPMNEQELTKFEQ